MNRVVAIVQARMSSTRLPGKVLRTLGDRSALAHVIGRLRASQRLDDVVVATSSNDSDDAVVAEARACGVDVVRGSLHDVLERYRLAAGIARADVIVRVTSDCPALDPYLLDRMLESWTDDDDYLSNFHPQRTFPRGLDLEVVRRTALDRAAADATDPYDREHVTPYIYSSAPQFFRRRGFVRTGEDLSGWRWTLDTPDDAAFFDELVRSFGVERYATEPAHEPLAAFLRDRPEIAAINAHVVART